ncbi:MAG: cell division protein ZapB [Nitrospiraceae bacterium]|nr:cell division protein ZapB [Nitrospiraceae bacterium]
MNYTVPTTIEQKIAQAVEKVKSLKEEKEILEGRVAALEQELRQKDAEIARLAAEKEDVKGQIEGLLDELDNLVASA